MNGSGFPLGRIQNGNGSLLQKIGLTCGVPDLNPTMLRRASEKTIQSNPDMIAKSKAINGHSGEVGFQHYDKSNCRVKSEFVNFTDNLEQSKPGSEKIDSEKEKKMLEVDKADEEARKQDAREFLSNVKERRSKNFLPGRRIKVNSSDRYFLQKLVYAEIFNSTLQHFPKGTVSFSLIN